MKLCKFLQAGAVTLLTSALLVALSSGAAQAKELEWHGIFGLIEAFNVVGVGSGTVTGAAPWVTTSGHAEVDLVMQK